jgi:cysteine-rich repeat protein
VVTDVAVAHNVRFGGTLTAQFIEGTNVFKGRLTSSNERCESGRRVAVFRVRSGADLRVASDRTNSLGRWNLVHNARAGDYYAKVSRRDIGSGDHNHVCIGIGTATFDIPPRCGNGIIEAGEACDDGNMASGDGCDSSCQVEGPLAQLVAKERDAGPKAPCAVRRFASGSA